MGWHKSKHKWSHNGWFGKQSVQPTSLRVKVGTKPLDHALGK
jgi:hypothetical protein